jgi:AraC-like DNA-binding protein
MTAAPAIDLSPLYRHCLLRSGQREPSYAALTRELTAHALRWRAGPAELRLHKAATPRLQLFALRYGAEVEVESRPYDGYALVHWVLQGRTVIEADGRAVELRDGQTALLAPRRSLLLSCSAGAERLIVKLPLSLLEASAPAPAARRLDPQGCRQWQWLLQGLLQTLADAPDPEWLGLQEQAVALLLRRHLQGGRAVPGEDEARLEALRRHIRTNLTAALDLPALARLADLSPRGLHALCRRAAGQSPLQLLREERLRAAHEGLRGSPARSVTEVALDCGFTHLGRFAAYYRQRYGMPPHRRPPLAA